MSVPRVKLNARPAHRKTYGTGVCMLTIGCHLSSSKGFTAMGEDALSISANTFAFFTRNPRGGSVRALDLGDVAGLQRILDEHGFGRLVAHAPYTYNACSAKERAREFAREAMHEDLERMEALPGQLYNFHPGAHVGQGADTGIELIVDALCTVMFPGQRTCMLLETMAGKGTEIGRSFDELARIIEGVAAQRPELAGTDTLGVCLDTCHIWDGGYDIVGDLDGVLAEFDRVVGLERLQAVHINDSKNPCGAHKDRHARIGEGYLGAPALGGSEDALRALVTHPALRNLPFILETPQDDLSGYAAEIAYLRGLAE